MANNLVITIGRQFGSGGRQIGKLLSEKLSIPYYDKEILAVAAKDSGICEELLEHHDEKPTRSLLFSLVTGAPMHNSLGSTYMDMPLNHKIFLAQFDAIRRVASEGPCVIVGRCADYVLRDKPNAVKLFVKADMRQRMERAVAVHNVAIDKAEDYVRKMDKQRASYYNYYATNTWGDINNYDLCLDTGKLGIEGSVELVLEYLALREKALKGSK
ncbi:MAG: cytidylate kinase-like family protein [Clostridia bacterium]|nr:cytidylate kinase-like family protein [Clostridia bacterium]